MYKTSKVAINSFLDSNISSYAPKFLKGEFNTDLYWENSNNYGNYLFKSYALEVFLTSMFNIDSDMNSIISFILEKDLFNIIFSLPNFIKNIFYTTDLNIGLETKYYDEEWLVVSLYTDLDPINASEKLDFLEDELSKLYEDAFLDNTLISVEFK